MMCLSAEERGWQEGWPAGRWAAWRRSHRAFPQTPCCMCGEMERTGLHLVGFANLETLLSPRGEAQEDGKGRS